jgi:hypothetical protein
MPGPSVMLIPVADDGEGKSKERVCRWMGEFADTSHAPISVVRELTSPPNGMAAELVAHSCEHLKAEGV